MNPVEEIKRRIELKEQRVAITNAQIEGLREALKVVEWADAIFIQHMMDVLNAIPQTGEVESGG